MKKHTVTLETHDHPHPQPVEVPDCQRVGCTLRAVAEPTLQFWPRGVPKTDVIKPAQVHLCLPTCRIHLAETTPDMILDGGGREQIELTFFALGMKMPDFDTAELDWTYWPDATLPSISPA